MRDNAASLPRTQIIADDRTITMSYLGSCRTFLRHLAATAHSAWPPGIVGGGDPSMLASQRSLASVQLNRSTTAVIAKSPTPWREAALEAFRRRNAVLDTLFYDVGKVTDEEARRISPWLAKEGAILIVPPTGEGPLELCQTIEEFADKDGHSIRALAVAGVGSSALGSAAFARNVADAFHRPVAAVVSGYGLADVVTEAAGGWFWFGTLNRFRHELEPLDDLSRRWQTSRACSTASISAACPCVLSVSIPRRSMPCCLMTVSSFRC
jgi:hypothetical protein